MNGSRKARKENASNIRGTSYYTNKAARAGNSGVVGGNMSNYNTFVASDPSIQTALKTSDQIEASKKQIVESEDIAKNLLVDLEMQRNQFKDMNDQVHTTVDMTDEVRNHLKIIAERSRQRKICLYTVIAALAITDLLVFYLLFVRR